MEDKIKLATWNLCLGLINKRDVVTELIKTNKIDICCLQEVDIPAAYDHKILEFNGYSVEIEKHNVKSRCGIYIKNGIPYHRKQDLEDQDSGLVIIDLELAENYRIINVYRVFNPVNGTTQLDYFKNQIRLIKPALNNLGTRKPIIIGDFNLNEDRKYDHEYSHRAYYEILTEAFDPQGLIQIVNFNTWTRNVNGIQKSSITKVVNLTSIETPIGDH